MSSDVFIHGIALANFRGFGERACFISPFEKFNFFIGPNNAGKSTVLSFIADYLAPMVCEPFRQQHHGRGESVKSLGPLDRRVGASGNVVMGAGVPIQQVKTLILQGFPQLAERTEYTNLLDVLLDEVSVEGLIWLERKPGQAHSILGWELDLKKVVELATLQTWSRFWSILASRTGGDVRAWIPQSVEIIARHVQVSPPAINLIPAIRQISAKGEEFKDRSGKGLIDELSRLQHPGVLERDQLKKFEAINAFVRSVTGNETAQIEIPHDKEHVIVHVDGKVLPLEALGTGIHEVVMLASFCTLMESQIVCIEEPERHLHPLLQRRFMQYLRNSTNNQYFIATHSPSLIDIPDAAVFHVRSEEGSTQVSLALTPQSRFAICRDLGYKASDLLQANAVIWVEGPSDRVYLKHWIAMKAPELVDGVHYSIMFYGGRLLSHLSADDPEEAANDLAALVEVRRLNRFLAVIMDSDRPNEEAEINDTKTRISQEVREHGGVAWVTAGREIENYVSAPDMGEALKSVYPARFMKQLKQGRYEHVLPFKTVEGKTVKDVDKVRVAKAVCSKPVSLGILDLEERVEELVALIQKANK